MLRNVAPKARKFFLLYEVANCAGGAKKKKAPPHTMGWVTHRKGCESEISVKLSEV